eukprot:6192864-Pleurochrysis_carterae.AAC.2
MQMQRSYCGGQNGSCKYEACAFESNDVACPRAALGLIQSLGPMQTGGDSSATRLCVILHAIKGVMLKVVVD